MKLGKLSARHDPRTLKLGKYLTSDLPESPKSVCWSKGIKGPLQMFKNDALGDCTAAGAAHLIMNWSANCGDQSNPTDDEVVYFYSATTGYNPKTGANDNGAVELDVLKYWQSTGLAGHKILGYMSIEPGNVEHVKQAVNLFGGLYIGVALPASAQGKKSWDVAWGNGYETQPGSWGGHCVCVVDYDPHSLTVITWGELLKVSWPFWQKYCDEAYIVISADWLKNNKTPEGFDVNTLFKDMLSLGE